MREGQSSQKDKNRFPLTGVIDEVGSDIQRVKGIAVDHTDNFSICCSISLDRKRSNSILLEDKDTRS